MLRSRVSSGSTATSPKMYSFGAIGPADDSRLRLVEPMDDGDARRGARAELGQELRGAIQRHALAHEARRIETSGSHEREQLRVRMRSHAVRSDELELPTDDAIHRRARLALCAGQEAHLHV